MSRDKIDDWNENCYSHFAIADGLSKFKNFILPYSGQVAVRASKIYVKVALIRKSHG